MALGDALEGQQQDALQRARSAQAAALRACDGLALRAAALEAAETREKGRGGRRVKCGDRGAEGAHRAAVEARAAALGDSGDALRARLAAEGR